MKLKLFLTLLFFGLTMTSFSQVVTIPDANFKAKLVQANTGVQIAKNLAGQWFKIDANSDGQIQTAEALQVSALYTNFSSIASVTGIASFTNLKVLSCFNNSITSIDVSALSQLEELYCYNNSLTSLVVVGTALKRLDCGGNTALTAVNFSGLNTLQYLDCYGDPIANLNTANLTNLETLNFNTNSLETLNVSGCSSLVTIPYYINVDSMTNADFSNCTSLQAIALNSCYSATTLNFSGCTALIDLNVSSAFTLQTLNTTGCTNLQTLSISSTGLTTLNLSGLNNLVSLNCAGNQLTSLNVLGLTNLTNINCGYNQLTTLDVSGLTNLTSLSCPSNQLLSLNLSGLSNLNTLNCGSNQLLSLDISECVSIYSVGCSNNQLLSIFMKNGKLEGSDNFGNPNFYFGNNPILLYICADEGEMAGVQQQIDQLGYVNCQVNSYCSFTPGGVFYTIQGTTRLDANANGCDAGDLGYANLKFNITDGTNTGSIVADTSGGYSIPVIGGTHTITPAPENPSYFSISPANYQVSFPATASPVTQDFCVTANGVHPDVEITLIPIDAPRPGFNVKYRMVYKNKGNQIANGQVTLAFQDDVMDLVSSVPATSSQVVNSLVWDYTSLQPFESRTIDFILNLNTPMETPPLNGNDLISFTASITPIAGDATASDNQFVLPQTVLNSFDPNDKTCLEGDRITPAMIGKYIHYKIRFENTGTFAAENIVIKDIIDTDKFDVSSLQMTNASHSCVTKITEGNKVEFLFENINLPFDDANNDGYVVFKIKTKSTVVLNDVLRNQASIYFDYNFPIITNEAQTVVGNALANQQFSTSIFKVYPNPVKNLLNIQSKEVPTKIEIFDANGRLLQSAPVNSSQADVSNLSSGTYFVKIYSKENSGVVKITKE
jgi:Leucine-rich repeat (LRR) protein